MYFATPEEVEQAFYDALSEGNIEAMKAVWLNVTDVACVHPMTQRLSGYRLVIGSFRGMFSGPGKMSAHITDVVKHQIHNLSSKSPQDPLSDSDQNSGQDPGNNVAIHSGCEIIHQDATEFRMQVTNIYRQTTDGWKMILHHASPIQTVDPPSRLDSKVH